MKKKTNKQAIIECLKDYAELSVKDIAEISGINARSAANTATLLRKDGVIRITNNVTQGVGGITYVYELTFDEVEKRPNSGQMINRIVELGGGPFGLMAAQLGARP